MTLSLILRGVGKTDYFWKCVNRFELTTHFYRGGPHKQTKTIFLQHTSNDERAPNIVFDRVFKGVFRYIKPVSY